jgi:hypothetical protein
MASLNTVSGSGSQSTTQSPQNLVNTTNNTEAATSVQPGTATSLLTTPNGIQLAPVQLSTVNLNNSSASTRAAASKVAVVTTVPPKHHLNSTLLGLSIGLFVLAIATFWFVTRSEKNTTNYD